MKLKIIFLSFLCFASFFSSCSKNKEIILDNSSPLAMAPDVQWALVIEPYSAFRKESDWSSEVMGHCRKGEIFQILGATMDNEKSVWLNFSFGWLPSNSVEVYSNKYKAETAASLLK
ncbi:MAG: hypothetical protein K6F15_09685 [Treponema sp.]|nr:hypothetical protein [Treponema sp.]